MKVKSMSEAWSKVDEIFPTDYEKDSKSSERAGYPVYRSTAEGHYYGGYEGRKDSNMWYTIEFFEQLADAERFAKDPIRARFVLAVYGREKNGTKKQFAEWLGDAVARGMDVDRAAKMNACVIW